MDAPGPLDACTVSLDGLIDYAGLFPPASLDMGSAVAGFRTAQSHASSWLVRRFICPARRLPDLAAELAATGGGEGWLVSMLASDGWTRSAGSDADAAAVFAASTPAAIDAVEVRIPAGLAGESGLADEIGQVSKAFDGLGPVFFELHRGTAWASSHASDLSAISAARQATGSMVGAKLRCGGTAAADFPSPRQVAEFIVGCAERAIPFKATAGLHKPIRHHDHTTGFTHHGFVNLLVATALATQHSLSVGEVADIVADVDQDNFSLTKAAASWRSMEATPATMSTVRRDLFTGYGSCDFHEPVDELAGIGVLPLEASP